MNRAPQTRHSIEIPSSAATDARALGAHVRRRRKELGLRQDEVAFAAGISPRTVSQIENGKATTQLDVLLRVLDALGLRLITEPRTRFASWLDRGRAGE